MTNIFNKNDIQLINFTNFLSGYKRDGAFPLNIFLPTSFSDIASSLGPGIFLIFLFLIIKTFNPINLKKNVLFYVCLSQILLLILFCQGRADYYAMPVIIAIYFSDNLKRILRFHLSSFSELSDLSQFCVIVFPFHIFVEYT